MHPVPCLPELAVECGVYTTGLGLSEAGEQHSKELLIVSLIQSWWGACEQHAQRLLDCTVTKGMDTLLYGP